MPLTGSIYVPIFLVFFNSTLIMGAEILPTLK